MDRFQTRFIIAEFAVPPLCLLPRRGGPTMPRGEADLPPAESFTPRLMGRKFAAFPQACVVTRVSAHLANGE